MILLLHFSGKHLIIFSVFVNSQLYKNFPQKTDSLYVLSGKLQFRVIIAFCLTIFSIYPGARIIANDRNNRAFKQRFLVHYLHVI